MEEIIDFLGEYAETLEAMEQKQIEKLGLLMTRELDKVEQTIMMQEAMDKKLENMEQRRRKLFVSYGIAVSYTHLDVYKRQALHSGAYSSTER